MIADTLDAALDPGDTSPAQPISEYVQQLLEDTAELPDIKDFTFVVPSHDRRNVRTSWAKMWESAYPNLLNISASIARTAAHRCTHRQWLAVLGAALHLEDKLEAISTSAVDRAAKKLYPDAWNPPRTKNGWQPRAALILEEGLWHIGLPPVKVMLQSHPAAIIPAEQIVARTSEVIHDALQLTMSTADGPETDASDSKECGTPAKEVNPIITHDPTNQAIQQTLNRGNLVPSAPNTSLVSHDHFLRQVQGANADRKARELAASQVLLEAASRGGDLIARYAAELQTAISRGTTLLVIPEEVGPKELQSLALTLEKLQKAIAGAVDTSRKIAGEPDMTIMHGLIFAASSMSTEEREYYRNTGQFPPRMLTGTGSVPTGYMTATATATVIDAEFEQARPKEAEANDSDNAPSLAVDQPDFVNRVARMSQQGQVTDPTKVSLQMAQAQSPLIPKNKQEEDILLGGSTLDRFAYGNNDTRGGAKYKGRQQPVAAEEPEPEDDEDEEVGLNDEDGYVP